MAVAMLLGANASAAEAPAPQGDAAGNSVSEVVVTGSLLPTKPDAVAVPVQTITDEVIAKGGVETNALEILRKEIPAFSGRANFGSSTANSLAALSAGTSSILVRNLDTLVLVNGRRVAASATAALAGGRAAVDVRNIPASAIARVEVLTDGASALYGSEAIGGVVNFILKQNLEGAEVGSRYAVAKDYTERSAYAVVGHNLNDQVNLTLGASFSHSDPLFQHDRSFTSPYFLANSAIPGAIGNNQLAANLNSPSQVNPTGTRATVTLLAALIANGTYFPSTPAAIGRTYDLSAFQTLLLKQNQGAFTASLNADLTGDGRLVAFADAEYARDTSETQLAPQVTALTVPVNAPFNPLRVAAAGVVFGDTQSPRQLHFVSKFERVTVGLKGEFDLGPRNVRWETGYTHSRDRLVQRQINVLYAVNLPLAVLGGFDASGAPVVGGAFSKVHAGFDAAGPLVLQPALDPFARTQNPAALANVLGTEFIRASSTLDSVDATFTSTLFNVPAGGVDAALGVQWRKESASSSADANGSNTGPTAKQWIGGRFLDPFSNSRKVSSIYSEVRVPVTSPELDLPGLYRFDLVAAGRYEHYTDAGDSVVPKLGFRWEPFDPQITVSGTYSESFTAPTLYAVGSPASGGVGGASVITAAFPGLAAGPFNSGSAPSPDLVPSTSQSYSLQVIFRPEALPNFKGTVQFFSVEQEGFISGYGSTNILVDVNKNGAASSVFKLVAKNNYPGQPGAVGFTNPGDLLAFLTNSANDTNLYLVDRFTNSGRFKVKSIDANLEYRKDLGGAGSLDMAARISYLMSFKTKVNNLQRFYEFAGTATGTGSGIQGTLPHIRTYTTLTWKRGGLDATLGHSFISSVEGQGTGGRTFETLSAAGVQPDHVKSYSVFDVRAAYDFGPLWRARGAVVAIGVNNIGNRMPPLAPFSFPENNADIATYSPIGRLLYVSLNAKF